MKVGNSLLLRDGTGRMDGYVQLCAGTLRCRVLTGTAETAELLVQLSDGNTQTFAMTADGGEQSWPVRQSGMRGACVLIAGHVRSATDARARAEGIAVLAAQEASKAHACETPPEPEEGRMRRHEPEVRADCLPVPQQRWPPPPCLIGARYDGGAWVIRGETQDGAEPAHGAP